MGVVVLPAAAAVVALTVGRARPGVAGSAVVGGAAAAFVVAVALAVRVAGGGTVAAGVLAADRLTVVLLLLVTGLAVVVGAYSRRYLHGDPALPTFLAATGLLAAATTGVAAAGTLVTLAVAWTASGAALCLLLAVHRHLPGGVSGLRRTATSFALGDLALWTAVLAVVLRDGDPRLAELGPAGGPLSDGVAVLLVVAALARSAQLPFSRWLPATVAAPTPVSALLHAGVVNAGGVLLVRAAPVVGESAWAGHLALAAGAATAVYGTALVLTAADVKGALALSTTAQMGFMVMACALGAWAAAVVHLVAHGMYKAALFLGSGSAVRSLQRERRSPAVDPVPGRAALAVRTATAVLLPALALGLALAAGAGHPVGTADTALVLAFAWASGAALAWGWLGRDPSRLGLLSVTCVVLLATPAYLLVTGALAGFLSPAVPEGADALPAPALLAVPVLAMVALTALRLGGARGTGLEARLYVWSLAAGTAHRTPPSLPRPATGPARGPSWLLPARPAESTPGARP